MKLAVAIFAYGGLVHADLAAWLADTFFSLAKQPCEKLSKIVINRTPTDVARNHAVQLAREDGAEWLLMLDHDTIPHRDWWSTAWAFAAAQRDQGPLVIAAPYCLGPPNEDVAVLDWEEPAGRKADEAWSLTKLSRNDAARRSGIGLVAAVPTGCCLFDIRAFDILDDPPFRYEYQEHACQLASTEDIVCSRNLGLASVPQYATWDHWAEHVKPYRVGRPQPLMPEHVAADIRRACGC